jgi:DNA-binding MarR family transcriptional regulator
METPLLVLEAAGKLKKAATRLFREFDLSPAQFNVLHLLSNQPDGVRAGDLAARLIVDPSNITGLLGRLATDGLVQDVAAPEDRRSRVVKLTAKGRARWQKAFAVYAKILGEFESALSAGERAATEKALGKIMQRCDELLD